MSERMVRKSVLFFDIYEPSLLSLYDWMFINRRVFVPSVSVSMWGCKRHILSNLSIIKSPEAGNWHLVGAWGWGIWLWLPLKCQIPLGLPAPPTLGLNIDRCIKYCSILTKKRSFVLICKPIKQTKEVVLQPYGNFLSEFSLTGCK